MTFKCPFAAPITKRRFNCSNAHEVVRRGGTEIDCLSEPACTHCQLLFDELRKSAIPAFGVEDKLTSMPHSVLVKIQYGGLLGLKRLCDSAPGEQIDDIAALVEAVREQYRTLELVPFDALVDDITGFKLERRSRRR